MKENIRGRIDLTQCGHSLPQRPSTAAEFSGIRRPEQRQKLDPQNPSREQRYKHKLTTQEQNFDRQLTHGLSFSSCHTGLHYRELLLQI